VYPAGNHGNARRGTGRRAVELSRPSSAIHAICRAGDADATARKTCCRDVRSRPVAVNGSRGDSRSTPDLSEHRSGALLISRSALKRRKRQL